MKLLFDTHAFIWWDDDQGRLPANVLVDCSSPANTLHLSLVSVWEIQIKQQLGKLSLRLSLTDVLDEQQKVNGLQLEPILLDDILGLESLPPHHGDLFDRLLVSQTQHGGFHLVSGDANIAKYGVSILW